MILVDPLDAGRRILSFPELLFFCRTQDAGKGQFWKMIALSSCTCWTPVASRPSTAQLMAYRYFRISISTDDTVIERGCASIAAVCRDLFDGSRRC